MRLAKPHARGLSFPLPQSGIARKLGTKTKDMRMPNQPISGNDLARFAGPQTFMRLPEALSLIHI